MKLFLFHRNTMNCMQFVSEAVGCFSTEPGKPDVCEAAAHS